LPKCTGRRGAPRRARTRRRPARTGRRGARSPHSRRMRALQTPLSATPPPKQRSGSRSRRAARAHVDQRVFEHALHARRDVGEARPSGVVGSSGSQGARGAPKSSMKRVGCTSASPSCGTRSSAGRAERAVVGARMTFAPRRRTRRSRTTRAPSPCTRPRSPGSRGTP
jgi:hypothetical protein